MSYSCTWALAWDTYMYMYSENIDIALMTSSSYYWIPVRGMANSVYMYWVVRLLGHVHVHHVYVYSCTISLIWCIFTVIALCGPYINGL